MESSEPSRAAGRSKRASLGLLFYLSWKTLGESRVSLALLLIAVAAGVAFQVPNRANLAGYRAELMEQEVSSGLGHVRVRPKRGERFRDVSAALQQIRAMPGVESAAPLLVLPAAVRRGGQLVVMAIHAVDTSAGPHRPYERTAGRDLAPGDAKGALIGERLARKLGVGVGDEIEVEVLLSTRPRLLLDDGGVGEFTLTVRGLVGFLATDSVFVDWRSFAAETGDEQSASVVVVHDVSADLTASRAIAAAIERAVPEATARAWMDDSRYVRSAVGAIDAVEGIAGGMTLFAVSIPVLALLYIDAINRRRQVSLLSAIGFRSSEIFGLFFVKALLVGVAGVLLGGTLGWAIVRYFAVHPIYSYEKFVIRPEISGRIFILPMIMVFVTTVLAGSLPAWRAARVNPSETLRRIE